MTGTSGVKPSCHMRFALLSDPGTERGQNEDACGSHVESATHVLIAVADGVSGEEGGDVASSTAIEVTLRAYRESPASWGPAKRLYRAAQQANIEIYDRALVVTELHGMGTTLTAIVIDGDTLYAAHVGDSRLYLIRDGTVVQKTKDHTVAAERRRLGLISAKSAKSHPKRSTLTRSLGRELIVAVDRIAFPIMGGDVLIVCSDGLYNVLDDEQLRAEVLGRDPASACASLVQRSNARGSPDNLTVAVVEVPADLPQTHGVGWRSRLARLLGA
jgi:PPM family protein phosphatase